MVTCTVYNFGSVVISFCFMNQSRDLIPRNTRSFSILIWSWFSPCFFLFRLSILAVLILSLNQGTGVRFGIEHDRRGAWLSNSEVRDLCRSFTRSFKSSGGDVITDVFWRSEQNFSISIALILRTDFVFWFCFGLVTCKFMIIKLWAVMVSDTCTDLNIWSSVHVMTQSSVCKPVCVGSFTSCFRPKVSIRSANSKRSHSRSYYWGRRGDRLVCFCPDHG